MIALAELAEAEGRALRRSTGRLAAGVALIGLAAALALVGGGLLLWALYVWLQQMLGAAGAGALTGVAAVLIAGILAWTAQRTVN